MGIAFLSGLCTINVMELYYRKGGQNEHAIYSKYDLLPYCRKHGGEVFEYPYLLSKLNTYLKADDHLDPYGYNSYEDYDCEIDRVAGFFSDQPEILELFRKYKETIHAVIEE